MKIGLFNYSDSSGGAARAVKRIQKSLIKEGLDTTLYVSQKSTSDNFVKRSPYLSDRIFSNIKPRIVSGVLKILNLNSSSYHSLSLLPSNWPKFINNSDIDIIHLNWINAEMMSIEDIAKISKPIVWTFHDMWPFQGSTHLSDLKKIKKNKFKELLDIDEWTYKRKQKNWVSPFQIVTPSDWLTDCVKKSDLMHNWPVITIPHSIDTEFWKPEENKIAKKLMGLDQSKLVILFGADGGTKSPNKGFDLLLDAIRKIGFPLDNLLLCIFGEDSKINKSLDIPVINFGKINDDQKLRLLYCASDICIVPSRQESFCQVALEAQSCGVPVLAFSVGGLKDIIDHNNTGYLINPFDTDSLAFYLDKFLSNINNHLHMKVNARKRVEKLFSMPSVAKQYVSVYKKILKI